MAEKAEVDIMVLGYMISAATRLAEEKYPYSDKSTPEYHTLINAQLVELFLDIKNSTELIVAVHKIIDNSVQNISRFKILDAVLNNHDSDTIQAVIDGLIADELAKEAGS